MIVSHDDLISFRFARVLACVVLLAKCARDEYQCASGKSPMFDDDAASCIIDKCPKEWGAEAYKSGEYRKLLDEGRLLDGQTAQIQPFYVFERQMYDRLDEPSGDDQNKHAEEIIAEYVDKLRLREE